MYRKATFPCIPTPMAPPTYCPVTHEPGYRATANPNHRTSPTQNKGVPAPHPCHERTPASEPPFCFGYFNNCFDVEQFRCECVDECHANSYLTPKPPCHGSAAQNDLDTCVECACLATCAAPITTPDPPRDHNADRLLSVLLHSKHYQHPSIRGQKA